MAKRERQWTRQRIERISHIRWFSRWPGYGPLHQSLKLSILQKFFNPGAVTIETGTSTGRTARALANAGFPVHTIEVDETVYQRARKGLREVPRITMHLGDSGVLLPGLLKEIAATERSVNFWLDGHSCGDGSGRAEAYDTAILPELVTIGDLVDRGIEVVVAVDDFRLFGNDVNYPPKDVLVDWARAAGLNWYVVGDIFIATTRQHPDC
jgi:hypothetical protein